MFAGKKSAQIREILISESAWEEMTCLFAPSLALMESGNTLIHSAGIINTQFLHDMDAVAMNRFMSNAEQGGNTLIIIVGNEQFEDLTLPW